MRDGRKQRGAHPVAGLQSGGGSAHCVDLLTVNDRGDTGAVRLDHRTFGRGEITAAEHEAHAIARANMSRSLLAIPRFTDTTGVGGLHREPLLAFLRILLQIHAAQIKGLAQALQQATDIVALVQSTAGQIGEHHGLPQAPVRDGAPPFRNIHHHGHSRGDHKEQDNLHHVGRFRDSERVEGVGKEPVRHHRADDHRHDRRTEPASQSSEHRNGQVAQQDGSQGTVFTVEGQHGESQQHRPCYR